MSESAVIKELAGASGVSEQDAARVLTALGLDHDSPFASNVSTTGFQDLKLNDLRISAKVGHVVIAK